jgi:hypothetical protein
LGKRLASFGFWRERLTWSWSCQTVSFEGTHNKSESLPVSFSE